MAAFTVTALMGFKSNSTDETKIITDTEAGKSYTVLKTDYDRAEANGWDEETMTLASNRDIAIWICPLDGVRCRILGIPVGWKAEGMDRIEIVTF